MKNVLFVVVLLSLTVHAQTKADCITSRIVANDLKMAQRHWMLSGDRSSPSPLSSYSVVELKKTEDKLMQCSVTQPDARTDNSDRETIGAFQHELTIRTMDFITRHGLWEQLVKEDAESIRGQAQPKLRF
jgi:hypothetical protein